jgi:hypothetical protein
MHDGVRLYPVRISGYKAIGQTNAGDLEYEAFVQELSVILDSEAVKEAITALVAQSRE